MKHPGHTYGGFVSAISKRGMTVGQVSLDYWLLAGGSEVVDELVA
jgi:hypothetical protein